SGLPYVTCSWAQSLRRGPKLILEGVHMRRGVMVWSIGIVVLAGESGRAGQPPAIPVVVDTPTVTVLKGLTVAESEAEMQIIRQALGVAWGYCHGRGH